MKKTNGNYYAKAVFTIVLIVIATAIIINMVQSRIDYNVETIKKDLIDEYYKCEFHYKELDYKGVCDDGMLDRVTAMIEFDLQLNLLEKCMGSPYAYRYLICEDMEAE